jgi:long-subunit acyl-CoA synthetase (AMP-forming)
MLKTPLQHFYTWESQLPTKAFLNQPIAGQWHNWTWQEAGDEIRRMATFLESKGYEPGSRIGILSRNCAHWMMADIAIMMSGHISVPIYPNVNQDTVNYVLTHSDCQMLFVGKLEAHDWKEMKPGIPDSVSCISFGMYSLPGDTFPSWQDTIAQHSPKTESPSRNLDEIMTIIYTSGTTGTPKGVVHKFVAPVFSFNTFQKIFNIRPEDRFFSYLPLSHIAERMLILMGSLYSGASVHFAESLDTFAANLKECSPTVFLGVPRIWAKFQSGVLAKFSQSKLNLLFSIPIINNIIKKKIREALGLSEARLCLTGAAPMPKSQMEWYERIGLTIFEVYGMTENSAYSHANMPDAYKFGTVGQAMEGVEVKLTEEDEICVKSLANMVEYYREPEKTAEALIDGFLHTGDKGKIDEKGFLRITGRVKDLFKTSKAKYVAPSPIEMQLSKNEFIEQVCVVGSGIPQPIALLILSEDGQRKSWDEIRASLEATYQEVNPMLEHHERLQKLVVLKEDWTVENGVLTPSLKIKRGVVDDRFQDSYEKWYEGGKGVIQE